MSGNGYYPAGADTKDAPWRQGWRDGYWWEDEYSEDAEDPRDLYEERRDRED